MTFTPNVTGNFLILAYANLGQSSTSYFTEWQLVYSAGPTMIDTGVIAPVNIAERATAGTHDVVNLSSGTSYSFKIQYRTNNIAGTASIEKLSLAAVAVPDYHHIDGSAANTTLQTYQDNATLPPSPRLPQAIIWC